MPVQDPASVPGYHYSISNQLGADLPPQWWQVKVKTVPVTQWVVDAVLNWGQMMDGILLSSRLDVLIGVL